METTMTQVMLMIAGLILADFGIKFGRMRALLRKVLDTVNEMEKAKRNGVLTVQEKSVIYDKVVVVLKEIWSIATGFFPNKSN